MSFSFHHLEIFKVPQQLHLQHPRDQSFQQDKNKAQQFAIFNEPWDFNSVTDEK